jgi:signal transduction histidine kinase
LRNSGVRVQALLDDLLDFNRTRLGLGVHVVPADIDLSRLVEDELDLMRGAHPRHRFESKAIGDTRGTWDAKRLHQLLNNLVVNAVKYGAGTDPVQVFVTDAGSRVLLEVRNRGPEIAPDVLSQVFEPLVRGLQQHDASESSLGLGLYIAREIARAHGGDIEVQSADSETVFRVSLPRRPARLPLPGDDDGSDWSPEAEVRRSRPDDRGGPGAAELA